MQTLDPAGADCLCVSIAGVDATIRAPRSVLAILNQTLAPARTSSATSPIRVSINVESDEFVWRINGSCQRSVKVLSATSALPRVAGAIVSSLVADVAAAAHLCAWRAAVVERDGHALAFIGDDWESGVVLSAHLHSRGWRLLGGDYALVNRKTLEVAAMRKLLYVTMSLTEELPMTYRRAVETSPWYSTPRDIAFCAVDPALVRSTDSWAEGGRLRAVLKLDGHLSEFPSLERAAPFVLDDDLDGDELTRAGVAVAELRLGDYGMTCDLVERWFQALVAD